MPAGTIGEAVLVVPDPADIQHLDHPPGVSLHWATRDSGATPLTALGTLQIPDGPRQVFFAAEAEEARTARRILTDRGLRKSEISAAAYWAKS